MTEPMVEPVTAPATAPMTASMTGPVPPSMTGPPAHRSVALRRGSGPARLLRRLIGVQEEVLDWVPEDRAKLSRTGAIVVCTALIAGLSVWIVLHEFLAAEPVVATVGAVFWASVIGVFDSWLISSTHGVVERRRFWVLVPRLLISVVLGVLISEPVTLKVFESAIVEQIKSDHQAAEAKLREGYGNCYPKPAAGADCTAYKLTVAAPDPAALQRLIDERNKLQKDLAPLIRRQNELVNLAGAECTGSGGVKGVSGVRGVGPLCDQRKKDLADFERTHDLAKQNRTLEDLRTKVNELSAADVAASATYETEVRDQIEEKIKEERAKHAATPGILERFEGLGALTERSWTVWWAHLLLAGLLVLIDCFPVLTKLISRPSAYDRRIALQIESKERLHDNDLRLTERLLTGDNDVRLHREEARIRQAMEESDYDARLRTARREAELRARIDDLVAQVKSMRTTGSTSG